MAGFGDIIGTDLIAEEKIEKQIIKYNENIYKIDKIYGEGTFGRVSKCSMEKDGNCQYFAIKQIKIEGKTDARLAKAIQEFKHEYEMLNYLKPYCEDNPLVCIYEHFEKDGNYYIIMEDLFAKGYKECMDAIHETNETVIDICNKLCESMLKLHSIKKDGKIFIHRDIKLDNIMYKIDRETREVSIKFIDFGSSCFDCGTDITGTLFMYDPLLLSTIVKKKTGNIQDKTPPATKCKNTTKLCYEAGDYYFLGMCILSLIWKKDWVNIIPGFLNILMNISSRYAGNENTPYRIIYTDMFIEYFIENFNAVSDAIDICYSKDPNFYNITLSNVKEKQNCIYSQLEDAHKLYKTSFVPFKNETIENSINNLFTNSPDYKNSSQNIDIIIKYVLRAKQIFHLLDYEVNFFEYPMHKRYIRLKSSLKPDSPTHSPSKKRARTSGGKKSRKNRGKFKKNKRTKKNLSQKKYNSHLIDFSNAKFGLTLKMVGS
jgi:serine/threonine protein kinase